MFATLLLSVMLTGQCGPEGCAPTPRLSPVFASGGAWILLDNARKEAEAEQARQPLKLQWVQHEGANIQVYGRLNPATGRISWSLDLPFNRAAVANAAILDEPRPASSQVVNYGLGTAEQMGRHAVNPSPEAKRFIAEAMADTAQSGKLHLTVIGQDQDRAQVIGDLGSHPAFSQLKDRLMIQAYRPDEWAVDPAHGFQVGGKPSIVVQQAKGPGDPKGGRVVYRALDYSMGPEKLAAALSAEVRKVDPSYNPTRDPGPASGGGGNLPFGLTNDDAALIGLFAVALIFLYRLPNRKDG